MNTLRGIVLLLYGVHRAAGLSCMDADGRPVDWFVAYKLPKMSGADDSLEQEGVASLYMDANRAHGATWRRMAVSVNDTGHPVARTLLQLYAFVQPQPADDVYYAMYNDNPPGPGYSGYRGHTKGVQLFGAYSGFWLIHSVPEFPPNDTYSYPESGTRYGQSFLCITMDTAANLQQISEQLYLYQPEVYLVHLSDAFAHRYPRLKEVVVDKASARKPPFSRVDRSLRTQAGVPLVSFAKHRKWGKDLYSDLVAPELRQSLYAETWQNGAGDLNASCETKYKTQTVLSVAVGGSQFPCSKDHSKWAVSQSEPAHVCIGDINRQKSQDDRGGGTMCLPLPWVWNAYRQAVRNVQTCCKAVDLAPTVGKPTGHYYGVSTAATVRPLCVGLFLTYVLLFV